MPVRSAFPAKRGPRQHQTLFCMFRARAGIATLAAKARAIEIPDDGYAVSGNAGVGLMP